MECWCSLLWVPVRLAWRIRGRPPRQKLPVRNQASQAVQGGCLLLLVWVLRALARLLQALPLEALARPLLLALARLLLLALPLGALLALPIPAG